MNWMDIGKQAIQMGAPILGGALGGPVGGAAGALIASVFGVGDTPTEVSNAIKADPESAIKLVELEQKHEQALRQMTLDERKAELEDTQQARTVHSGAWMPWALTCILAAMVVAMVAALVLIAIPDSNREVIYLIVGQLIGAFATGVNFWLGSSQSSKMKDSQIAAMQK